MAEYDKDAMNEFEKRTDVALAGPCVCGSADRKHHIYHGLTCPYRVIAESLEEIERLRLIESAAMNNGEVGIVVE